MEPPEGLIANMDLIFAGGSTQGGERLSNNAGRSPKSRVFVFLSILDTICRRTKGLLKEKVAVGPPKARDHFLNQWYMCRLLSIFISKQTLLPATKGRWERSKKSDNQTEESLRQVQGYLFVNFCANE